MKCWHTVRSSRALLLPLLMLGCMSGAGIASAQPGTWTSNGPGGGTVFALAIDPLTPTTIYAGTYLGGVFKSANGGASWSASNTGLTNTNVRALAIDPLTPTTIYAGTYLGGGVFKSANGGASWSASMTNTTYVVQMLAIDPRTPTTIYAAADSFGGVFKSANGGATWSL